ncbi:hypothetical protein BaRGS_00011358, partial [Batillaria attramentaria]
DAPPAPLFVLFERGNQSGRGLKSGPFFRTVGFQGLSLAVTGESVYTQDPLPSPSFGHFEQVNQEEGLKLTQKI